MFVRELGKQLTRLHHDREPHAVSPALEDRLQVVQHAGRDHPVGHRLDEAVGPPLHPQTADDPPAVIHIEPGSSVERVAEPSGLVDVADQEVPGQSDADETNADPSTDLDREHRQADRHAETAGDDLVEARVAPVVIVPPIGLEHARLEQVTDHAVAGRRRTIAREFVERGERTDQVEIGLQQCSDAERHLVEPATRDRIGERTPPRDDLGGPTRVHLENVPALRSALMYPGAHLEQHADKPALIMADSGWTQTFAELDAAANRLSQLLRAAGLQPGDHIAMCLENHPRFLEILWGCEYAGLIYTAISSRLTTDELQYIINDCGAKAYITSKYKAEQAAELVDQMPNVELRLMLDTTIDGYESYESAVEGQPAEPLPGRVAGTDMLYSSGTTGRPKGVLPAYEPVLIDEQEANVSNLLQLLFGMDDTKRYLSPAPMYHAAPLRFCLATHRIGATLVLMERFDAEEYLKYIQQYEITHSQVVPTMFVRMLKLDEATRSQYDVSSIECVVHAAAPCPVEVKKQMIDWWGPVLHEYYAGTEGNGFVYCNSEMWLAHEGTVGMPIQCEVHIVGEDGEEVPRGESGTVFFEGGSTFEYHNDPEKTAGSRHPKGWSTLGDVGYLDEDNFLYLTDRKAYMIITGGVNVYPQEAENVLTMHPKVFDVAVFGVPNDDFGEEVKAVVQPIEMPADDAAAQQLAGELIQYCRDQLADVKCPRSVDFREELPRHPTGKLYKRLLKDEYWAAAGRSI